MHLITEQVDDPSTRRVFEDGPQSDMLPIIDPSGRLVAYTSGSLPDEEIQVFVRPFPSGAGRWQVSVDGGGAVAWSAEGDRLYDTSRFGPGSAELVEVQITLTDDGRMEVGTPQPLFELAQGFAKIVPMPGSDRFLAFEPVTREEEAEEPAIVVIEHWATTVR